MNSEPTAGASEVEDRYREIRRRIEAACARAGRDPTDIRLVGAGKKQSVEKLRAAWDAGLRIFAENRVQEAEEKIPRLPAEAEWHLIGPLQSNKVKKAVGLFRAVHSVDRLKIGRFLDREAAARGLALEGFVEVNLGEEETKHGFLPADLPGQVAPLAGLAALRIVGLMAIPPWEQDPEKARGWFVRLRRLRDELWARPEWARCPGYLSMGMSEDFEIAIEEGATHVRVGTALFGPRPAD